MKELNKNTAAGVNGILTQDLKKMPISHITSIMNYWWGWKMPKGISGFWTTLLPKKKDNLGQVGNWRPITITNILIRLYANLWDKRIIRNASLDERQKGFVPVDGCYENVKILQQTIKQQRKRRKEHNLVFIEFAKAFDSVTKKYRKGTKANGYSRTGERNDYEDVCRSQNTTISRRKNNEKD